MPREELRARLLHGAGDIFYRDGIAATTTATISRELGISKRTMYEEFPTKDELVAAALAARDEPTRAAFLAPALAAGEDPHAQLRGLVHGVEQHLNQPTFRGCPFLNAAAEFADSEHPVHAVARHHKEQLRAWIQHTAHRAGLRDPRALSEQLLLLIDGALAQGAVRPPAPGQLTAAAHALIDAADATTAAVANARPTRRRDCQDDGNP